MDAWLELNDAALVECRLETGRTHQVRVHMARSAIRWSATRSTGAEKAFTESCSINWTSGARRCTQRIWGFVHPVTKGRLSFDSALPSDMQELFNALLVYKINAAKAADRRPGRGSNDRWLMRLALCQFPRSGGEAGLNRYLSEIKKFPILAPEEEYMLAKRWREHGDTDAAARLVNSHLRLVAKIAMGYRGYGLPVSELISEGNIGLMQGVKKFEPDRGFRLATYAMWWIRASIQEFILRSWSLVKMGTTAAQKKLFFNLRRMKNQIDAFEKATSSQKR